MTNPYAQAGWFNADNFAISRGQGHYPRFTSTPSPAIGALPRSPPEVSPNFIRFSFDSTDGDIIDCAVVGSGEQKLFEIRTELLSNDSMTTRFTKIDGAVFAQIEWASMPIVEIESTLPKQHACAWIQRPMEAKQTRIMLFMEEEYTWERHKQAIYLYKAGKRGADPELMAKFCQKHDSLTLDVTPKAISIGILESVVVALVILTEHHVLTGV